MASAAGRASRACRCYELGEECPSCRAAIERRMERDGDPMLPADYDRLDAGPFWNSVPS